MSKIPHVAYFCMEFGLHESFPIYSGGLGILAGDFMKSAHDLGLPVVGIGLKWERGYGVQNIGSDGEPVEEYPAYDAPWLKESRLRVRVRVRGQEVPCKVWFSDHFGSAPIYLIEPHYARDRWITHRLYEAGTDVRIAQEMLLGIGGLRVLNWLGLPIETYHFNEGHAVFAGIEMIADQMEGGMAFAEAWAAARGHIVFTTHTPVKAGNEEHSLADLRRLGACLQLSDTEMEAIGGNPFSMTVAGLRLSRKANAVSELHAKTARAMWAEAEGAAPIISITNGVHVRTWQSERIRDAGNSETALWEAHAVHKRELVDYIRERNGIKVDPDSLIVGFARRAAGYKRGDLILRDPKRLEALLARRVTLVFSGKSHPQDRAGKAIVARLARAQRENPSRVVFLENYDMSVARRMVRGCDVWLNNPVRPLEASGTSGMKAAMNGVLNVSILDGWWPEGAVHGKNGWAIGDETAGDDERDMEALHDTLANQVLPAWADRARWIGMMQASIRMAVHKFSSDRMVRDYFEKLYPEDTVDPAAEQGAAPARPVEKAARSGVSP